MRVSLPLLLVLALLFAGCAKAPILPEPEPTFGIPQQQQTLLRWLKGDFAATDAEGRTVVWRIRPMGGFRAMIYMERFVDGAETPDRQELWYLDNSEAAITFQSWRHVRPYLFAGATSDQRRLDNEYIYDLRRNEGIDLKAEWREGHFLMRTIRPSSSTGPAGHPDSRPNIMMIVGPDTITRSEVFTKGSELKSELRFERVQ
jgi:hypothetical protein